MPSFTQWNKRSGTFDHKWRQHWIPCVILRVLSKITDTCDSSQRCLCSILCWCSAECSPGFGLDENTRTCTACTGEVYKSDIGDTQCVPLPRGTNVPTDLIIHGGNTGYSENILNYDSFIKRRASNQPQQKKAYNYFKLCPKYSVKYKQFDGKNFILSVQQGLLESINQSLHVIGEVFLQAC